MFEVKNGFSHFNTTLTLSFMGGTKRGEHPRPSLELPRHTGTDIVLVDLNNNSVLRKLFLTEHHLFCSSNNKITSCEYELVVTMGLCTRIQGTLSLSSKLGLRATSQYTNRTAQHNGHTTNQYRIFLY